MVAYPYEQEGGKASAPVSEYLTGKLVRVLRSGGWQRVLYTVPLKRCIHHDSVRVTKKMVDRARRENRTWGQGLPPPASVLTERHVVTNETYEHLRDWIFSTDLLEPVKASEQSTQRGHCFAVKEAVEATFPRYQRNAEKKGVDPVAQRVYRRVLSQRVFTKYRKDHCMCTTCLRNGWRGIMDKGKKVISMLDALDIWPVTVEDGEEVKQGPVRLGLCDRLKRLTPNPEPLTLTPLTPIPSPSGCGTSSVCSCICTSKSSRESGPTAVGCT